MFCQRCGAQLSENTIKCPNCGAEYAVENNAVTITEKKITQKFHFSLRKKLL